MPANGISVLHPARAVAPRPCATVIQFSDFHLLADPHGRKLGVDVQAQLNRVVAHAREHVAAPDLVLLTGDLAHDGSAEAYRHVAHAIGEWPCPIRAVPGNHDDPGALRAVLGQWIAPVTDVANWRIVTLDSTLRDDNAGELDTLQWEILEDAVADASGRHVLVALHHNLLPVDPGFEDVMMLRRAPQALRRLQTLGGVRVVLWGHVHQAFDQTGASLRLLATPATSFQFAVRDGKHSVDDLPAGYRWLELFDDGTIETGILRLDARADAAIDAALASQA